MSEEGTPVILPESHLDLLDRPLTTLLTTEMPDGRLQSTVVWCNRDGDELLLNTMREFQKARNLRARPRATVLVIDPEDDVRWMEVRGDVTLEDDGALEHLDLLCELYMGEGPFFGHGIPAEFAAMEHPVRCRLVPTAVVTGGRFARAGGRSTSPKPAGWNERRPCTGDVPIPETHLDLVRGPLTASLATRLPSGAAQTQPVWYELDGNDLLVNTSRERRKGRNLESDPRATLLVVDPHNSSRWIEIRADADLQEVGAVEQLDRETHRYTGHDHYYGSIYPVEQRQRETRVIARLHPRRIACDAIHA